MSKLTGVALLAPLLLVACEAPSGEPFVSETQPPTSFALAIHGGAGVLREDMADQPEEEYLQSLEEALTLGRDLLAEGAASLDVVEQVVRFLEDDPKFNAGKGSVFTHEGTHEMDAAIMDGRTLDCGAVSGLTTVRNPIGLARLVMERSRHVFLAGAGAEHFATEMGVERVEPDYFFVERRYEKWQKALRREAEEGATEGKGTVGAAALDQEGNVAAATSTGGLTNKRFGRIGDVPVIGAGTYANNRTAALSCTGKGEQFIRNTVAHDISALMEYQGLSLQEAAERVIHNKLATGDGGVIGVARDGSIALVFNTEGMFRGAADSSGRVEVKIWE